MQLPEEASPFLGCSLGLLMYELASLGKISRSPFWVLTYQKRKKKCFYSAFRLSWLFSQAKKSCLAGSCSYWKLKGIAPFLFYLVSLQEGRMLFSFLTLLLAFPPPLEAFEDVCSPDYFFFFYHLSICSFVYIHGLRASVPCLVCWVLPYSWRHFLL